MIRNGVVAILAVLALAAPAWAGGERFTPTTPSVVMPFRSKTWKTWGTQSSDQSYAC